MKSKFLTSSLLIVSMPFAAHASESQGPYVGLGIGQSSVDVSKSDLGLDSDASIDDSDTAFKIFGGYDINKHFAVELGYIDLGEVSAKQPIFDDTLKLNVESDAIIASAIGKLPLNDNSTVFAKIGYSSWDIDASVSLMDESESFTEDGSDVFFGFGYAYSWTNVSAIAEFERYDIDGEDIDFIGVSFKYSF